MYKIYLIYKYYYHFSVCACVRACVRACVCVPALLSFFFINVFISIPLAQYNYCSFIITSSSNLIGWLSVFSEHT